MGKATRCVKCGFYGWHHPNCTKKDKKVEMSDKEYQDLMRDNEEQNILDPKKV